MAYCTPDDVIDQYGTQRLARLTGDPTGAQIDADRLQKAVDGFGDFIEQHVRMQHPDNPFDETHQLLNGLNVEGALLRLKKVSPGGLDDPGAQAEKRLDRILERIAQGRLRLLDQAEQAAPEEFDITPSEAILSNERLFGGHRTAIVIETS